MMNPSKEAHDIIVELADKAEKDMDLNDPYIQKLILELNAAAQMADDKVLVEKQNQEYYSVKDVAELFDVSKQTVYKWIEENKIEYEEDNSPGKIQRKGYRIPKKQFQTEDKMNRVDPTFRQRREEDMEGIPDTDFDQGNVLLPKSDGNQLSHDEIKRNILRKKK